MRFLLFCSIIFLSFSAHAQVIGNKAEERIKIAREIHVIKPIKPRIDRSINNIASRLRESDQRAFASTVKRILNYKAIETASINAMAEIYTLEELQAMLEYYSKPEAKSAAEKQEEYQAKVGPEITRMLDRALMEMRTGGSGQ